MDYNAVEGNLLTFSPVMNVSCATVIPIIDDNVLEDDQTFSVMLSTTELDVLLDPASATVTIVNDDGEAAFLINIV